MQWGPFLPKGGGMIQVDIDVTFPIPPRPPSQFHLFPCSFHHLLFLAFFQVLNFRSSFDPLNTVFWGPQHDHSQKQGIATKLVVLR